MVPVANSAEICDFNFANRPFNDDTIFEIFPLLARLEVDPSGFRHMGELLAVIKSYVYSLSPEQLAAFLEEESVKPFVTLRAGTGSGPQGIGSIAQEYMNRVETGKEKVWHLHGVRKKQANPVNRNLMGA